MRIFVTGASGYIGNHVAAALRRAGHHVVGLVRSREKARELARQEIRPVIGTMDDPHSYLDAAAECSVLVHAAMEWSSRAADLDRTTVEALILAGNRGSQPKTLVYTSGVWIYGATGRNAADEMTPVAPPRYVAWRPAIEHRVLSASSIRGVVARPGCIYGKRGGLTASWFAGIESGNLKLINGGLYRWALVHADDMAEGYVRLIESGRHSEVFNFTDRSRSSVAEMVSAAAEAAGKTVRIESIPLPEASNNMGDVAECLALDQHVDSRKAVRLLGWQPRFGGFADGAGIYLESWRASQD